MNKIVKTKPEEQLQATASDNPWADIAAEFGSQTRLAFKKGVWSVNDEKVDEGTQYIALIDRLTRGFIKFNGDDPPELRIALVTSNKVPQRHELGDVDRDEWEVGDDGKPKDPWVECWQLPLMPVDAPGELLTFATNSVGGRTAIADLCGIYNRSPRNGLLPIIEIRTSSFYNKKTRSDTFVPVLKLVSWHNTAPVQIESENPAPFDPSDEVPF